MALFQVSDFTGFSDSYAVPAGSSDAIVTGSVDLILSTGITQQVFDTLSTALRCIRFMEQRKLYSLSPDEGVTIINLRSKILKMMDSYVFTYMEIRFKQFIARWLTWFLFQKHLLLLVTDVLGCLGVPMQTLKWKPIVLIKTALGFKLLITFINRLLYPIRIFKIHRQLLFQVSKYSKNKLT